MSCGKSCLIYQKMDIALLTRLLLDVDWTHIINKDINTATTEFITTLHGAASAAIPRVQLRRKRNEKSWITACLKRNIRKRERLFKIAKETQNDSPPSQSPDEGLYRNIVTFCFWLFLEFLRLKSFCIVNIITCQVSEKG